ncbi:cation/H(+) antiporter 15-like [Pistacia vera]|uniref:cation/H(+) antiporter 15-like n=1 Tax=Pistacia vera TaxID=55513 RepID=UPI001263AF1A|nr:cation/H(+) antiporter 15-like [Pistacia vera]
MVKTKVENRIDGLEKEMGSVKEDLGSVKEYLLEFREWMRLRDKKEESQSCEKGKVAMTENSNSEESGVHDRSNGGEIGREDKRIKKLELLVFNGDDPYRWTFRANQYFVINQYEEEEKVEATAVCIEGRGGIILGPSFLGGYKAFNDKIFSPKSLLWDKTIARVGIVYFIFIFSVKLDKSLMLHTLKRRWGLGLTGFIFPFITSFCVSRLVHNQIKNGISGDWALMTILSHLSLSYFSVVAHALDDLNLVNSELGHLALSCALSKDIVAYGVMILFSILQQGFTLELLYSKLSTIAMLLFSVFILRPQMMWIIKKTPEGKPIEQIYVVAILLGALVMGALSDCNEGNLVQGAVLMGLIIPAGPPLGSTVVEKCEFVNSNILLPYLHIRIGLYTNIYSLKNWVEIISFELILLAAYFGKMVGTYFGLLYLKPGLRNAIIVGLMLNVKGILDFISPISWTVNKIVDEQYYTQIMISRILLTAIIQPLIAILYKPRKTAGKPCDPKEIRRRTLQTTALDSELRILCGVHFEDNVHSIITFLKATNTNTTGPICAYIVHLVELVGRQIPMLIPYDLRKRRSTTNATDRIIAAVSKYSKTSIAPVTIQPYRIIASYDNMHESVINLAEHYFVPLILIPFNSSLETCQRSTGLRNFNLHLQTYSPCSVGILLDRGLPRSLNSTHFSYNVAVFFLGGHDDREVMALVKRMSTNPDVSITVLRILLVEVYGQADNDSEKSLDEMVIKDFMATNIGNASVVCHETVANNTKDLVDVIRSADNNYDLVITGTRRGPKSILEKELLPWTEYKELGVIGDMIASSEFCWGMVSVLAMHSFGDAERSGFFAPFLSYTEVTSDSSSNFSSSNLENT